MNWFLNATKLRVRRQWLPLCCPAVAEIPSSGWNSDPMLWEDWLHRQGLMAVAYANLRDLNLLSQLPGDLRERLEHYYIDCRFSLDRGLYTLRQAAEVLHRAGLEFILLKGPSISIPFYPDPATRPLQDLDLLVRESDHTEAIRALEALSYRQDRPESEYAKGTMTQRLLLPHTKDLLPVEVHWDVVNSLALRRCLGMTPERAFATATEDHQLGDGIRVLAPPLRFVHTCVHAVHQHQLSRLIWLLDVLQMIRCQPLDTVAWVQEFQTTESSGVKCAVYACPERIRALWPSQAIPVARGLRPRPVMVRSLLGALPAASLVVPEAPMVRWRRKVFRVALRCQGTA